MEPEVFLTIDSAITNQKELLESCCFFFYVSKFIFQVCICY